MAMDSSLTYENDPMLSSPDFDISPQLFAGAFSQQSRGMTAEDLERLIFAEN